MELPVSKQLLRVVLVDDGFGVIVLSAAADVFYVCVCVFITAGPFTKLCAWGRRRVEDMCYEIRRAEACVD